MWFRECVGVGREGCILQLCTEDGVHTVCVSVTTGAPLTRGAPGRLGRGGGRGWSPLRFREQHRCYLDLPLTLPFWGRKLMIVLTVLGAPAAEQRVRISRIIVFLSIGAGGD